MTESQEKNEQPQSKERNLTQLKYPIPSAYMSFERHIEVLKAYVIRSKEGKEPVSYRDFGGLTVSATTVSSNNKFFENLGLIRKAENTIGKYIPSETAISICNYLKWKQEEAKKELLQLVANSWFGNATKNLLEVKEKASRLELIKLLGYESGADPEKHAPALAVMIDYLTYTGFVRPEGDVFVLGTTGTEQKPVREETKLPHNELEPALPKQRTTSVGGKPTLQIAILVTPEMSEERIRQVIRICLDEVSKT